MILVIKRTGWLIFAIIAILAAYVTMFHSDWLIIPPFEKVSALSSDKYDGDCTGHETVGRCADKCPANTSEGVYYLQGFDKDTGAAVCGFSYYHACPYADAQPTDGAICQKLTEEAQQAADQAAQQPVTDNTGEVFYGK